MTNPTQHQQIIASAPEGGDFERELIPEDNHLGRCVRVVHLGTVSKPNTFKNGELRDVNEVRITFEIPEVRRQYEKDGEKHDLPALIGQTYTLSLAEKAKLYGMVKQWRGKGYTEEEKKGFNIAILAGVPCMIGVVHEPSKDGTKTYANIASITKTPKGINPPEAESPILIFGFAPFDLSVFSQLSKYEMTRIMESKEFAKMPKKDQDAARAFVDSIGTKKVTEEKQGEEDLKFTVPDSEEFPPF